MNKKNTIFLISGPSGVGKDSVIKKLNESNANIKNIITITTRKIRENEISNKDYIFVNKQEFETLIKKQKLIEWSEVYGNYYGVPLDQIENNLQKQNKIIIKTDIQGIKKLKQKFENAITIFIMPPDIKTLLKRLKSRKTDSIEDITKRSDIAIKEMEEKNIFDHIVINKDGDLMNTIEQIKKIILN
jgi:guanylate kinase|tara:strand:- start:1249 stop:1809 length:561 start_codon:yes stop_codon:yes gene_type:complete